MSYSQPTLNKPCVYSTRCLMRICLPNKHAKKENKKDAKPVCVVIIKKQLNVKHWVLTSYQMCEVKSTLLLLLFAILLKKIQWFFLFECTWNKGTIGFSRAEKALKIETWRSRYCFRVHAWQIYIYESGTLSQRLSLSFFFSVSTLGNKKVPSINAHYNQMFDQPVRVWRGSFTRPSFLVG